MNKRLLNLIFQFAFFLVSATAYSQAVTMSAATGGLATTPQPGGITNIAIFGVQLNKAAGAGNTVTSITVAMTTTPIGKFTNARLYESTDATFSGIGTETLVTTGTISATDISFTGAPLSNFDGLSTADDEFFFVVVDVDPSVTAATVATQPSLAGTGVVVTTGTTAGATITGTNYAFVAPVTTIANLSTGLAASPLMAGATNQGVFGFSLTSTGTQTVSTINVQVSSTAVSKWGSYALITSTDNSLATTGDNSAPIGGLTFNDASGTQIAITGLSETITTTGKNYFLIVTVNSGVTGATTAVTPSLALANVTVVQGTVAGSASGTAYSFTAPVLTIANLSTGLATSPLLAGSTGQGIFGFSLTSSASQTVTAINVQVSSTAVSKWGSYSLITSTDNDFSTTGDNSAPIGGLTFNDASGTQIAITGLSESITTTTRNYFLVVNVNGSVNAATAAVQPSIALGNVTATPGTVAGSASGTNYSFAPLLTIATLSTGLAPSPLIAGATGQGVFGFSLTSTGTQTVSVINVQVSSTAVSKWGTYALITSADNSFATTGDNSAPIGGLTFNDASGTQIAITGLSENITTATKNYFLVVTVNSGVTGATTAVTPSLVPANLTFSGGGAATGSVTGTNYSFTAATATFTEITAGTAPVIAGTVLSAGTNLQVLTGFSATSNSTQQITAINFNYTPAAPTAQFSTERLYRSTTAGLIGTEVTNDGSADGVFTGLTETINSTPVYFYLVVDVANSVTIATPSVLVAPTQANITVAGNKNPLAISRTFTFNTSQTSDITLTAPFTTGIGYRTRQFSTIDNSDVSKSVSLATYSLRDGAGTDSDNKGTNLTSLTISLTNFGYVRQIALFDNDTNNEIAGTEQTVSGGSVTFTPSSPISTTDNGVRNLAVRATFHPNVIDNDHIQLQITGATANTSGSGFSPLGGWASTTTNPIHNLIDVVATKLVFDPALPTTVSLNTNFSVRVRALDGLNNLDVNQTDQFSLTESGPGTLTSFGGTTLTPFLVAGEFQWTDLRLNLSGSYPFIASDDNYDDDMGGDATGNITINSPASTITPPADPVLCYGNPTSAETLGNIVITETDPAGISGSPGSYTFSLALPSGFLFDQSVTSGLSLSGGSDVNTPSAYTYPGANVVQFSFNLTGTSNTNTITIGGLRIYATHPGTDSPAGTGGLTITRLGGNATIAGVTAGTTLAAISATQQNPAVTFTVDELTGNPEVDPATTTFNVSSAPVKLISSTPVGSIFTGNGVTSNPEYRFNPNSLSSGTYPVTLTQTAGSGCQSYFTQDFEVIISGIVGLAASYCSNASPATGLTVNQAYIDQIMQYYFIPTGWALDKFVYYDHDNPVERWQNITPVNDVFDPNASAYADEFAYWGGEIPIGFSVYNVAAGVNAGDNYVVTYQWVRVNPAPAVAFAIEDNKRNFCIGDPTVDLTGVPQNSDDIAVDYFRIDGAVDPRLTQSGTNPKVWKFTAGSPGGDVGTFALTYSYLDPATSCRGTSVPIMITVNEVTPAITFPNNVCAGDPVNLTNATTVLPASATIVKASWNFGDLIATPSGLYADAITGVERTTGTYEEPSHLYANNGTFQIQATFETSDGCVFTAPSQPVNINALPNANFTWTNACLGSPTVFNATQNLPDGQISSWNWNFAMDGNLTGTGTTTGKNTSFNYAGVGKDTVRLIVITNTLCRDTVYKPVFIVPTYSAVTETSAYSQNFNTGDDGWISGGRNSSWQLDIPGTHVGATITELDGNAWDTNPAGQNNAQESSWVLSGCFDLSSSTKPVISFDTWSDNQYGSDGAVLQYNITGNIEEFVSPSNPDGDWVTVGLVGQGINWYDDQGIIGNPGNQSSASMGWTGKDGAWKKSTFKLDPLIGQLRVLFRVAFASPQPRGDGFAFDNVFVGERSRIVLLENFTNAAMDPPSGMHNFDNYQDIGTAGELVKVQYHTAFPVLDPVNELNEQMHNARSAFYGVTQSPTIRIDGDFQSGDISVWRDVLYDERVLTPSSIRLSVSATKVGEIVEINTTIENTTSQSLSLSGFNIFTTIVEKSVTSPELLANSGNTEFEYVAKQMLPSPAGRTLNVTILPGGTFSPPKEIWQNPVGDAIVVFVQDITGNKNVYQAALVDTPPLPEIVTGTEDDEYSKHIRLYPNPASNEVNIQLPVVANKPTPIALYDTYGRVVFQSEFKAGEKTKTVPTTNFADGMYMMELTAPQGTRVVRKIMVKH